jgi:hypothetical protein
MPLVNGVIIYSLLTNAAVADRSLPLSRLQVEVSLVGDDGLTQRLEHSLQGHITSSADLELSVSGSNVFRITTSTNVVSDTLGGRRVIIYRAMLLRRDAMLVDKLGACFEQDVDKCANDIVRSFRPVMITHARD